MTKQLLLFALLPIALSAQILDPVVLTKPATDAWPTYNGDYSGRRFSTLNQIDQSNVMHLTLGWVFRVRAGAVPGAIVGERDQRPWKAVRLTPIFPPSKPRP